jgi:hypothetical protein
MINPMRCKTEQGKRPPASLSDHWSGETPGIVAPVARRAGFFGTLREMAVHAGAIRPDRIRLTAVTLGGGGSKKESPPFLFGDYFPAEAQRAQRFFEYGTQESRKRKTKNTS